MERKTFATPRLACPPASQMTHVASLTKVDSSLSPRTPAAAPVRRSPRPATTKVRALDVSRLKSSLNTRSTAAEALPRPCSAQASLSTRAASPGGSRRTTPAASLVMRSPRPKSSFDMRPAAAAEELPRPSSAQASVSTRATSPGGSRRTTPAASMVMCLPSSVSAAQVAAFKAHHGLSPLSLHGNNTAPSSKDAAPSSKARAKTCHVVAATHAFRRGRYDDAPSSLAATPAQDRAIRAGVLPSPRSRQSIPSPRTHSCSSLSSLKPHGPASTNEPDLCTLGLKALPPQPDHDALKSQSSEACHKCHVLTIPMRALLCRPS